MNAPAGHHEAVPASGAPSRLQQGGRVAVAALALVILAGGCTPVATRDARRGGPAHRAPSHPGLVVAGPGAKTAATTPVARDTRSVTRITAVTTRVPASWEVPPLVGRMQHHYTVEGENLLEIARQSGLGFREVRDANPPSTSGSRTQAWISCFRRVSSFRAARTAG